MPAVIVFLYVVGGTLVALGIRIISRRAFPGWMKGIWLWPLIRVTPPIAVLSGWAAVLVGAAAIATTFATFETAVTTAAVDGFALICAAAALLLIGYGTWLSRQPETGAHPPSA